MKTVEGYEVNAKLLQMLGPDEKAVFAAQPSWATLGPGQHWNTTSLLLTDKRMLISKDRLFGRARPDFEALWSEVEHVEGSLWNGGGPQIQLLIRNTVSSFPIELIIQPQFAVDVESAIRSGYLSNPAHPAHRL